MIGHSKPWITDSDLQAVNAVLTSGMLAQGSLVADFESKVAQNIGTAGGVAVGSGTAALVLALKALGVDANHEVIVPTYVCKSVAEAVVTVGAKPVLCDVGEQWTMTVESVTPRLSKRTAAIIVVHTFGIPVDITPFWKFGIPIIEDCCQSFGAQIDGKVVGSLGTLGVFSFHATKCLTTGEGGLVASSDVQLLHRMRDLRDGGYADAGVRVSSPMTDMQAALGLSQLSRYPEFLSRRSEIERRYLKDLNFCSVELPTALRGKSMFFRFPVRSNADFDATRQQFATHNVQVRRGVDELLHRILGEDRSGFPMAESLFKETVSIPIYPGLGDEDIDSVIAACHLVWHQ